MRDSTRRTAKAWLAIAACAVGLAAAGLARATTSTIAVDGFFNFQVTGDTVVLTVDKVSNVTVPPRISGELYLELWAFRLPYTGLAQAGYQQNGYKLASHPLGRLAPGFYLFDVNSGPVPYSPPPPGTWYITSLITEYDAGATNTGGVLPRAFGTYSPPQSPVTIAPAATPQAGFWWDPAQIGTGYAITVKNGIAVVAVYTFQPDGAPLWYLSSGALSADGLVFTGALDKYVGGPCFSCAEKRLPTKSGNDGTITIVFDSPASATAYLPGGRVARIVPADF
jgi:hypothetical protein